MLPLVVASVLSHPSPPLPAYRQSANRLLAATWEAALPAAGYQYSVVKFNGECCVSEIERLAEEGRRAGAKAIVGCGGGKVCMGGLSETRFTFTHAQ